MDLTTRGRYRVLGRPRRETEWLLIDVDGGDYDPVYVDAAGAEDADLAAGDLVEATLAWRDGTARFESVSVVRATRYHFRDDVTGLFEAARDTWREAVAAGEGMNSRVTHTTDGDPAGALYVFAEQPGVRDLFEEMRTGVTPIEPLVERVNRGDEADVDTGETDVGPRAVFVLRPADEAFVCVYVVFERDGMLARTVRDTYCEDASLV